VIEDAVSRVQTPGQAAILSPITKSSKTFRCRRGGAQTGARRAIRAMEKTAALAIIISPARERLMGLDVNAVCVKPKPSQRCRRALLERLSQLAARKEIVHPTAAGLEIAIEELTEAPSTGWTAKNFRMSAPTATPRIGRADSGRADGRPNPQRGFRGDAACHRPARSGLVAEDREGFAARYHARARSVRSPRPRPDAYTAEIAERIWSNWPAAAPDGCATMTACQPAPCGNGCWTIGGFHARYGLARDNGHVKRPRLAYTRTRGTDFVRIAGGRSLLDVCRDDGSPMPPP